MNRQDLDVNRLDPFIWSWQRAIKLVKLRTASDRDTQSRGTSISEKFPKINDERQDGYFEARFDLGFVRVKHRRPGTRVDWRGIL